MATTAQKTELLEQARAHYEADMLLKGTYADDEQDHFRGCSVGCHLKHIKPDFDGEEHDYSDKHSIVARYYGYPEWLARLQDTVFESLPNGESAKWHVQLAETLAALPDDHDWQLALHRVHVAILRISYRTAGSAKETVQRVIDLHECAITGSMPSEEEWSAARSAARSAAESAARSAAWSAAWSAAESVAWSVTESAAWYVAESAARSAAESAAESAAWFAARSAARSVTESFAWSAAESAARSAAEFAARSAAFQEMRDVILAALPEPVAA